jgi:hypothetical protein
MQTHAFVVAFEDKGGKWMLTNPDNVSMFYDGSDIQVLHSGGLGVGTTKSPVTDAANVYRGPVPIGGDGHPQAIWLAYCSDGVLKGSKGSFPDLESAIFRPDVQDTWQGSWPDYPRFVVEYNNTNQAVSAITAFRNVNGKEVIAEMLNVSSYLRINDRVLPTEYIYSVYYPGESGRIMRSIRVTIQATKYEPNATLGPPAISSGGARIADFRISGVLTYVSSSWRSEAKVRADPKLQGVMRTTESDAARAERIASAQNSKITLPRFLMLWVMVLVSLAAAFVLIRSHFSRNPKK